MYAPDHAVIATPIGRIALTGAGTLQSVRIGTDEAPVRPASELLRRTVEQLERWFAGEQRSFDLPLAPAATPRGAALRDGIVAIGYATTASYGELARRLGSSPRAIGQACARNPLPLIVPCHRVLAAAGALGAYSAGDGPATKRWLLAHEQRHGGPPRLL